MPIKMSDNNDNNNDNNNNAILKIVEVSSERLIHEALCQKHTRDVFTAETFDELKTILQTKNYKHRYYVCYARSTDILVFDKLLNDIAFELSGLKKRDHDEEPRVIPKKEGIMCIVFYYPITDN